MKVVLINFSGNVGKTMAAGQLLKPRMQNAPIFSVESINIDASVDGLDVEKIKGKKFGDLLNQIMQMDQAIVDVGASNVEDFLKLMQQYAGSHEEFDYFVVPVVKEKKQQADTVNTLRTLATIGVPRTKIRLLFNKVDVDDVIQDEFAAMFGLAASEKIFTIRRDAVIYTNEVFERLKSVGKSLGEITTDDTDYRSRLRESTDDGDKEFCIRMIALKRLSITANRNLDDVFETLFK